jgi:hypothetical protein
MNSILCCIYDTYWNYFSQQRTDYNCNLQLYIHFIIAVRMKIGYYENKHNGASYFNNIIEYEYFKQTYFKCLFNY